jgi:hypothetical protein
VQLAYEDCPILDMVQQQHNHQYTVTEECT